MFLFLIVTESLIGPILRAFVRSLPIGSCQGGSRLVRTVTLQLLLLFSIQVERTYIPGTHITQDNMREIVHLQAGQCGNQIGAKVGPDPGSTNAAMWRIVKSLAFNSQNHEREEYGESNLSLPAHRIYLLPELCSHDTPIVGSHSFLHNVECTIS